MLVSLILCNFNGNQHLARSLPLWSALGVEIIVADACSDVPPQTTHTVIRGQQRGSKNSAVNNAARAAHGQYLLICDNDILPFPDLVTEALHAFQQFQAGILTFALINEGAETTRFYGRRCGFILFAPQPARTVTEVQALHGTTRDIAMGCMLIRRDEFIQLGGFSTLVPYGFDDTELSLHYTRVFRKPIVLFSAQVLQHVGIANRSSPASGHNWSTHVFAQLVLPQCYFPRWRRLGHVFVVGPYLLIACMWNIYHYRQISYAHGLVTGFVLWRKLNYRKEPDFRGVC